MEEKVHVNPDETRYEIVDASVRDVVLSGIGLAVVTALVCLLMWGFFNLLKKESSSHQAINPMMPQTPLPPEPRLQEKPYLDLESMRKYEDQMLNTYGWVDKNAGKVRLPIDRAMDELAQRGLPVGGSNAPGK
jgi:hypothetical protein